MFLFLFFQPKRRARRLGNLCAFYERALPSKRHVKYSPAGIRSQDLPTTHFNLQSAHNPRWYMGFNKPGLKHIGLRFSPEGHDLSLPRRMGRPSQDKLVRPRTKCDFRFYSGIFISPSAVAAPSGSSMASGAASPSPSPSLSWAGMLKKIELRDHENSVRSTSSNKGRAFNAVQPQQPRWQQGKAAKNGQKRPKYLSSRISRP